MEGGKFWYFGTFPACAHLRGRASAWSSAGGQTPPRGEEGQKTQKVLRKPLILSHFLKSQILRLKQGFPLLAGPLFCESKGSDRGLPGDRPELAQGVVWGRRLRRRGGDEGGGEDSFCGVS